jgi:GNAT superfamily N-acetyltransferase
MTEEFHIRPARLEDAESIANVQMKTWQGAYAGIFPEDKLAGLEDQLYIRIERWRSILRGTERLAVTFVAENSDQGVIGFSNASKQLKPNFPQDAELYAIYLLREYHGKKIGRRLMSAAAGELRSLGFSSLLLWVLAENSSSRGFYEHLGGKFAGEDEYLRWGQTYHLAAYAWDSLDMLASE